MGVGVVGVVGVVGGVECRGVPIPHNACIN